MSYDNTTPSEKFLWATAQAACWGVGIAFNPVAAGIGACIPLGIRLAGMVRENTRDSQPSPQRKIKQRSAPLKKR